MTNANQAMQDMMNAIDVMKAVYIRETEALNAADANRFMEMQDDKLSAAKRYQAALEDLLSRKEEIKTASPALKRNLLEMEGEFTELSQKNLEALDRMRKSTDRLGTAIRRAAKDAARKQRAFSYGENGALRGDDKKSVSMGVSETA